MRQLDAFGPFFSVATPTAADTAVPAKLPAELAWRPLRDLLEAEVLAGRVETVHHALSQRSLRQVPRRVAASTLSLSLFSRLVSPPLGALVLDLEIPQLDLDQTMWSPAEDNSSTWLIQVRGKSTRPNLAHTVTEVVAPLSEAIASRYALSTTVLRGNLAASLVGANTVITQVRPELAPAALSHVQELTRGPLSGTGELSNRGSFVRNSCCLYYRIHPAELGDARYCGDCILRRR